MNKRQQKFRQQRAERIRKAAGKGGTVETAAPPVVGQIHNPALHQATKPLAPELEAAIIAALKAGPSLVFVVQYDAEVDKVHCYRMHSLNWSHSEDVKAEGLVVDEFAKMRAVPAQPAQAPSKSGW